MTTPVNHKALVTGASRGIGKAIRDLFESKGIEVLAPTRQEMDLASAESIEAYVRQLDGVDILVNNAGINDLAAIEEVGDDQLSEMLQVNLVAQFQLIRALTPGMRRMGYGRIVNFASIWSSFSKTRRIMYSMAKAGVKGLTTAAAVELSSQNILVNAVAPGFVLTEMTYQNNSPAQIAELSAALPIKRMAQPAEIAEFVYFLCSPSNSFITGQTIMIDGGFSCV